MTQEWERVRPRTSRLRVAGAGLLAVAVVGILVRPGDPSASPSGALEVDREETPEPSPEPTRTPRITRSTPRPSPSPSPTDDEAIEGELGGVWHDGAPAPERTTDDTTIAWDGAHGVYLVGGRHWDEENGTTFLDQVWRYDIAADTWTTLPPLPLGPLAGVAAAWTGTELVVWGGWGPTALTAAGAAYDPGRDAWRELPPSPLSPRYGAAAVSTADGVLILGGADHATGWTDGARYDPADDRWTSILHEMPEIYTTYEMRLEAFPTRDQVVVYEPHTWGPSTSAPLRLRDGLWATTTLPDGPHERQLNSLAATADGYILALRSGWGSSDQRGDLIVLPSDSDAWQTIDEVPLENQEAFAGTLVSDRYFIVIGSNSRGVAYDLLHERWLEVPDVPATSSSSYPHLTTVIPQADGVVMMPPRRSGGVRRFVLDEDELTEDAT